MIKAQAFCFKYGFLWIGWILEISEEKPRPYYDNRPSYTIFNTHCIRYFCIGLREKKVFDNLKKFCEKSYKND